MSIISGALGMVNGATTIRNWGIDSSADVESFSASNTHGGTVRLAGYEEWGGSFSGYGHTPPVMPGESFAFLGSIDGEHGASGQAMVDRIAVTVDIERGGPVQWTCAFSGNGQLTFGDAVVGDLTTPSVPSSKGCSLQLGSLADPAVWTPLPDVRTATFLLQTRNRPYRSSSTDGQTLRLKGNVDWSLTTSVYCSNFADLIPRNTIRGLRLFVSETEYWELLWGIFGRVAGLQVNREAANILAAQYMVAMTGVATVGTTPTLGSITNPGGTKIWPATGS